MEMAISSAESADRMGAFVTVICTQFPTPRPGKARRRCATAAGHQLTVAPARRGPRTAVPARLWPGRAHRSLRDRVLSGISTRNESEVAVAARTTRTCRPPGLRVPVTVTVRVIRAQAVGPGRRRGAAPGRPADGAAGTRVRLSASERTPRLRLAAVVPSLSKPGVPVTALPRIQFGS